MQKPKSFSHDPRPHLVVEGHGNSAFVSQFEIRLQKYPCVPDGDELACVLLIFCADVDVEFVNLGDLLAIFFVHQVNRLAADYPGNKTFPGHDRDALRSSDDGIDSPNWLQMKVPFIGDVLNDEPDLVAVTCEHDARLAVGITHAKDVADDIGPNAIAPWANALADE